MVSSEATAPDEAPIGIDVPAVTAWMTSAIDGVTAPLSFNLIAGGRSNLTYEVTDAAGRRFALRRPPVSHVLPTAHDMTREFTVIDALADTAVPVPRTFGLCSDPSVSDRPFYVMEFVDGHILRNEHMATAQFPTSILGTIGSNLAVTLAGLHAVDVGAVGLSDLGRHDGYIERQLKRWTTQYQNMAVDGVDHGGLVEAVGARLAVTVPTQQGVSIVHGDYRLDNTVIDDGGQVAAILDWEICTLGDPLADLGTLLCYWAEPSDGDVALLGAAPTLAPGFEGRADLLRAYGSVSSLDLSRINYYVGFGFWRLACILQGVYARYVAGAGAGDRNSVDAFPAHVRTLAEVAAATLDQDAV